MQMFVEDTSFSNRMVLGAVLPTSVWEPLPHFLQSWLRNFTSGTLIYFVTCFLWCFYIYYYKFNVYVHEDGIPSRKAICKQIYVSMKGMPWFSALPTISEYLVENGWSRCFPRISDVGWVSYATNVGLYWLFVEFNVYWMHRMCHDVRPLYKYLHATHHVYNKQNMVSPFAGLALHPLDGILHSLPHVVVLYIVPTHFTRYIALMFLDALWTINIHDNVNGKFWPLMGAGYHIVHHTTNRHNYGRYTIWMDWMFGTLCDPKKENKGKKS